MKLNTTKQLAKVLRSIARGDYYYEPALKMALQLHTVQINPDYIATIHRYLRGNTISVDGILLQEVALVIERTGGMSINSRILVAVTKLFGAPLQAFRVNRRDECWAKVEGVWHPVSWTEQDGAVIAKFQSRAGSSAGSHQLARVLLGHGFSAADAWQMAKRQCRIKPRATSLP